MTGSTFARCDRRFRSMWVMAGGALFDRIMGDDINLRIPSRLSWVVSMAECTMFPVAGDHRFDLTATLRMGVGGAMAGFTIHHLVVGLILHGFDIIVAFSADLVSGVLDLVSHDRIDRSSAIMPILTEGFRDEKSTDTEEDRSNNDDDDKQTLHLIRQRYRSP